MRFLKRKLGMTTLTRMTWVAWATLLTGLTGSQDNGFHWAVLG